MKIHPEIFRAYDIRGIVGETLTNEIIYNIGCALGSRVIRNQEDQIVVGRDGRLSGERLLNSLIKGLMSTGVKVVNVGEVATPMLYFATHNLKIPSGIMLTGSHNPPNYNGLKIILNNKTIYEDEIKSLITQIKNEDYEVGNGSVVEQDISYKYINYIVQDVKLTKPLKIVVDCGNGIAGKFVTKLYEKMGATVISLFCEVDGNFPNHHPDPGDPKNLIDLIEKVKKHNADFGLAFDGDGDRLGVIDSNGKIIWPDRYLMLFAKDILQRNKNASIIFDIKSTKELIKLISDCGGKPILWKTGHSLIKAKMKEENALLAGEMSGHVFFKERWFGFDDGLYAGARLLEILSQYEETSAKVFAKFPENYSTPEITISVDEESKFSIMSDFVAKSKFKDVKNLTTIDGIRVEFEDGWGLIRPSNTTAKLVTRFEAHSEVILQRIQEDFKENLLAVAPELKVPF